MTRSIIISFILPGMLACQGPAEEENLPNIIYILADDLGYGDLGCNGQELFTTPNLDRLAEEGMKFTQHYSGSTVCAPSRSALMTGQHTGHTPVRGNKEVFPEGQWPLPEQAYTIAEMLQESGYVTGAFGKWGLGYPGSEGAPGMQGFDVFYGYNCQRKAHHYYPYYLWDNDEKVILDDNSGKETGEYAPMLIHQRSLQFLEQNRDRPFFMFYPSVIPHAELFVPEKYKEKFRGRLLPEKVYQGVDDGESFRDGPYGSQSESHAAFAGMVSLLDEQVGEIMTKLEELGIEKNTLVIFTSDNGPHQEGGADPDYFNSNGNYRGYKRDLYEGGIRVPTMAWWPGKIKAGTETDHISAFWDVLPTLTELTGAGVPDDIDGISFLPVLLGKPGQKEHEYLYWEFHERGGRMAVRKGDWKLVRYNVQDPDITTTELYDILNDPGEKHNVSESHPGIVSDLMEIMSSARTESEVFVFQSKTYLE